MILILLPQTEQKGDNWAEHSRRCDFLFVGGNKNNYFLSIIAYNEIHGCAVTVLICVFIMLLYLIYNGGNL